MKFSKVFAALVVGLLIVGMGIPARAQEQRTKNFALIVDQSSEMQLTYHNDSRHRLARDVAKRFVENVPKDLDIMGAVYMYGIVAAEDSHQILRVQGFTKFNRQNFLKALKDIGPQLGPASLSVVFRKLRTDLDGLQGRTSLIIISSGSQNDPGNAKDEAEKLADVYKNICFYTIQIGDSKAGEDHLKSINRAGASCGTRSKLEDVDSDKGMGRLIKHIFYKE